MSTESLKRVLMAIKGEARGMRKNKLEGRLNPKPTAMAIELSAEPSEETDEAMALGPSVDKNKDKPPATPPESGEDSEDEKAATLEEIRRLLARS